MKSKKSKKIPLAKGVPTRRSHPQPPKLMQAPGNMLARPRTGKRGRTRM